MKKTIQIAEKIIDYISYLGTAAMLAMMILTFVNVILRKFFSVSILGAVELTQQLLVCIIWFGAAHCAVNNGMIEVDIFHFPKLYLTLIRAISFIFCLLTSYSSILTAAAKKLGNARTTQLHIPTYPFYYVVAFGYFLMALALVVLVIRDYLPADDGEQTSALEEERGAENEP